MKRFRKWRKWERDHMSTRPHAHETIKPACHVGLALARYRYKNRRSGREDYMHRDGRNERRDREQIPSSTDGSRWITRQTNKSCIALNASTQHTRKRGSPYDRSQESHSVFYDNEKLVQLLWSLAVAVSCGCNTVFIACS